MSDKPRLKLTGIVQGGISSGRPNKAGLFQPEIQLKTRQSLRVTSHTEFWHKADTACQVRSSSQKYKASESLDTYSAFGKFQAEKSDTRRGLRHPSGFKQTFIGSCLHSKTDLEDDDNQTNLEENKLISSKARLIKNSQSSQTKFALKDTEDSRRHIGRVPALPDSKQQVFGLGANLRPSAYPNPITLAKNDEEPMPEDF